MILTSCHPEIWNTFPLVKFEYSSCFVLTFFDAFSKRGYKYKSFQNYLFLTKTFIRFSTNWKRAGTVFGSNIIFENVVRGTWSAWETIRPSLLHRTNPRWELLFKKKERIIITGQNSIYRKRHMFLFLNNKHHGKKVIGLTVWWSQEWSSIWRARDIFLFSFFLKIILSQDLTFCWTVPQPKGYFFC